MSSYDDIFIGFLSLYLADKIHAAEFRIGTPDREFKILPVGRSERLHTRLNKAFFYEIACFLDRRKIGRTPFHVIGRKRLDIEQQLSSVEQLGAWRRSRSVLCVNARCRSNDKNEEKC
jgi:hypothetical protein